MTVRMSWITFLLLRVSFLSYSHYKFYYYSLANVAYKDFSSLLLPATYTRFPVRVLVGGCTRVFLVGLTISLESDHIIRIV